MSANTTASQAGYGYAAFAGATPAPSPADPRAQLVAHVEDFNGILKRLACDLAVRFPTDATIDRAKKRILLAIDVDPVFCIDAVGPYLYKYREGIYASDEAFFIENDYDAELRESVDAEKADLSTYIIPKVKEAWGGARPEEKDAYKEIVHGLLDCYLEYLAVQAGV